MLKPWFSLLLAAVAAWPAIQAHASHESAPAILNQFKVLSPRLHVLKPAPNVRALPASTAEAARQRISADVEMMASRNFSLVVIEKGELLVEAYGHGATAESPLNSYSMAKSLTALAVGEAMCAGKIKSLDDKAAIYVPALQGTAYGASSIRHLLSYTSGAKDPGGDGYSGIHNMPDFLAVASHRISLLDLALKHGQSSSFKPGEKFIYNGLDSETLSLVVRAATGMSLPKWFEVTVWHKAGAQYPAGWFVDRQGNGIGEMLVLATTRDYARVGVYVLERLTNASADSCMNDFMKEAARPLIAKDYRDAAPQFGLGLHVGADGNTWFFGHSAQRVGINAKTGRVVATNGFSEWPGMDAMARRLLNP
jgi:CubicO group peptidase (beta-lactamase class C family)